jgi:mannose-6-phosphate isomerase-like protein (cupin superfamily)
MYEAGEQSRDPVTGRRRYYHPDQKDYATFLKTSEETGGERTLIEVEVAPGGGTPPHYHKTYQEGFEVLEGELEVHVGGEMRTLRVGEKATVPLDTLHNFHNPTGEPTTFLVEPRPGSEGFEKALKAGYGLASDGRNPPSTPTTWRCSWDGRTCGCPASSPSPSRYCGFWPNRRGARGLIGSWRRNTAGRIGAYPLRPILAPS